MAKLNKSSKRIWRGLQKKPITNNMKIYSVKEGEISHPDKRQLGRIGLTDKEKKHFSAKSKALEHKKYRKVSDYTGDASKSEGWKEYSRTNSVSDRKPLLKSLVRHLKKDR